MAIRVWIASFERSLNCRTFCVSQSLPRVPGSAKWIPPYSLPTMIRDTGTKNCINSHITFYPATTTYALNQKNCTAYDEKITMKSVRQKCQKNGAKKIRYICRAIQRNTFVHKKQRKTKQGNEYRKYHHFLWLVIYKTYNAQKKCHFANIQLISARFFFSCPPSAGAPSCLDTKIAYEVWSLPSRLYFVFAIYNISDGVTRVLCPNFFFYFYEK